VRVSQLRRPDRPNRRFAFQHPFHLVFPRFSFSSHGGCPSSHLPHTISPPSPIVNSLVVGAGNYGDVTILP
jgi:hypothetical protein